MQNIDVIKQTSPSGGKPFLPLAALGSSAILIILLMGASNQFIARSQPPYSFDAQSETTIEIVDTPVTHNIISKPDVRNRVGNDTIPGRNSNKGLPTGTESMQNNMAQESMQWNLPEDAKARLGKGRISEIQYASDGALLVVATGIGIWIYDTTTYQEVALLTAHTSAVNSALPSVRMDTSLRVVARMAPFYYGIEAQVPKKCSPGVRNRSQTWCSAPMDKHLPTEVAVPSDSGIPSLENRKPRSQDSQKISVIYHSVRMAKQL